MNCKCEQFHPNLPEIKVINGLFITDPEIKELLYYFVYTAGYISYEHDAGIHTFIKRLQDYEKKFKIKEISK